MTARSLRFIAASLLILLVSTVAKSQEIATSEFPPMRTTDNFDVSTASGQVTETIPVADAGNGNNRLSVFLSITFVGDALPANSSLQSSVGPAMQLAIRPIAASRESNAGLVNVTTPVMSGIYINQEDGGHVNADGSLILQSRGPTNITEIRKSGVVKNGIYDSAGGFIDKSDVAGTAASRVLYKQYKYTNGNVLKFWYQGACQSDIAMCYRLRYITSSTGYGIQFRYDDTGLPGDLSWNSRTSWVAPRQITAYSKADTFCNEAALDSCSEIFDRPNSTDISYIDSSDEIRIFNHASGEGKYVTLENSGSSRQFFPKKIGKVGISGSERNFSSAIGYYGGGQQQGLPNPSDYPISHTYVSSVSTSDGTWTYQMDFQTETSPAYDGPEILANWTRKDPSNTTIFTNSDMRYGLLNTYTNENGKAYTANYDYLWHSRDYDETDPIGRKIHHSLDYRGNETGVRIDPVAGGTDQSISRASSYPIDCVNPLTCNKPTSSGDFNGNVTSYTYDPVHGGVLTETLPAGSDGVYPVRRYGYVQRHAWVTNGSGGFVREPVPVWLLSEVRICRTTQTVGNVCAGGAADEVATSYDYGPDTGTAGNNLLLRGLTVSADGTARTTCYGYDSLGNQTWETKPRAGLVECY